MSKWSNNDAYVLFQRKRWIAAQTAVSYLCQGGMAAILLEPDHFNAVL